MADPEKFAKYVKDDALALRSKLDHWFRWMLRSAGLAPLALALYVIGASLGTVYYAKWWVSHRELISACALTLAGIALGIIVTVLHSISIRRLSSAEIIAGEEDDSE